MIDSKVFPSPIGELHFSITCNYIVKKRREFPSPIGELHFSIGSINFYRRIRRQFPSPIGELHFSIRSKNCYSRNHGLYSFRPLSGNYISQWRKMVRVEALRRVSVPYRGTTFLNSILSCNVSGTEEDVSVPYRGTTFLN